MNTIPPAPHLGTPSSAIEALNRECFCISLDQAALARALDSELGQPGLSEMVRQRCPYLFAAQPVFVSATQLQRMAQVVQAVESVVALPAYREQVLAAAPAIARLGASGPQGAFFGYDFYLDQDHLGLIEINTNAGGAMLNLCRQEQAPSAHPKRRWHGLFGFQFGGQRAGQRKGRHANGFVHTTQGVFGDGFVLRLAQNQPDDRRVSVQRPARCNKNPSCPRIPA